MDADVKGADGAAVARLAEMVMKDRGSFEANVKAAVERQRSPRSRLEEALLKAMDAAVQTEMVWGRDDCALWAISPIVTALAYDPGIEFRGRYRTRIGAQRVLGKGGLAKALRSAARRHGWHRVKVGAERVGDLGLVQLNGVYSMVVCRAEGWFVARNEAGFTAMPSSHVRIIWAVI